ncbi:uncharacterized protein LOC124459180 [Xenia sp. Carnegie-2017]|uniref:uncharacterized protein LOC124459180 n=1 Tax=Xenia sp. Carnegie-2017 TaxID=2897299 RepID=UPI001F03B4BA|nr:uncharacterized protein LOC124459180 [Xenia sp. Carnegie-2017]
MATTDELNTSSTTDSSPVTSTASMLSIIKLPPYWPNDPELWFSRIDAQFTTRNITSQKTKYAYVVARDPYDILRRELIHRTSTSEQQRLHQLLTGEELGDRKPSQLLRKMEQLLGSQTLPPSIMKQLFVQRLPTNVQAILAPTQDTLDLNNLAKLADKIREVNNIQQPTATLSTVATEPIIDTSAKSGELHQLRKTVSDLAASVQALNLRFPSSSDVNNRPPRPRNPQPTDPTHRSSNNGYCWYHAKFGATARKCVQPCTFHTSLPSNYNARQ